MQNNNKDNFNRKFPLVTKDVPFQFVEAYKSLRTNLQFASLDKKIRRIVVTSAIPGEGKTTVAVNLAVSIAEYGYKVLIIDGDLRKPAVHRYLHLDNSKVGGLTTALADIRPLEKCTAHFSDIGIYVITSGPIPPNPSELIGSKKMEQVIQTLSNQYDYIIIDTPPVSVVTDAAVVSKFADGIIYVLRQNYTSVESAKLAKKNLENVGANVIGCVFNAFDADKSSKSYAYYHYKKYDYSYK